MDIVSWITLPIKVVLYVWAFWYLYILIMGFYRAKLSGKLTKVAFGLALPAVVVGYLFDLVANWTVASLWFRELPRKPLELVTDRLTRYLGDGPGWRFENAQWICHNLLDYFDPHEQHCR